MLALSLLLFTSLARAQKTEVTVSFNEQFFDALLDAIFSNSKTLEFPLAQNSPKSKVQSSELKTEILSFREGNSGIPKNPKSKIQNPVCDEKIVLRREMNGVRTAVRFRGGRIFAPIAFSGSYNPPLIGCVDFQGFAETNIELAFDAQKQALIGNIKVLNVQLGGAPNIGGVLARFVQSSIDRKINPIEILRADKLAFIIPVQNSGINLKLRATGFRHDIGEGVLNVHVEFEFVKQ